MIDFGQLNYKMLLKKQLNEQTKMKIITKDLDR